MIIEGWILVLIILATFVLAFACVLGWIFCAEKLNQKCEENKRLRGDITRLKVIIARKNGAITIQEATDYYNDFQKGAKK